MRKTGIASINDTGIYGIYYNYTLIYIGKTNRKLKYRWASHIYLSEHLEEFSKTNYQLYHFIFTHKEHIRFKTIITGTQLKKITKDHGETCSIDILESLLIAIYNPIFNIQDANYGLENNASYSIKQIKNRVPEDELLTKYLKNINQQC